MTNLPVVGVADAGNQKSELGLAGCGRHDAFKSDGCIKYGYLSLGFGGRQLED